MKRKQEKSRRLGVVVTTAVIVGILSVVRAYPVPLSSNHPLLHSLATFATTNSFMYTNKIGSLNYRFIKPQLSPIQRYVKFGGFPPYQEIIASPETSTYSPMIVRNGTTGEIKLVTLNNISRVLTPPTLDAPTATQKDSDDVKIHSNERLHVPKSVHVLGDDENDHAISASKEKAEDISADLLDHSAGSGESDKILDNFTLPTAGNNSRSSTSEEKTDPDSNLENLVRRVINAPFREASSAGDLNVDVSNDPPHVDRKDSNFEQPITFFQPQIHQPAPQQGALNEQRAKLQLPPLGTGNYRFLSTSQHQQPAGIFAGTNRFAIPNNNLPSQRLVPMQPTHVQSPLQPQQQAFTPTAPQFPQSPFPNVNGLPTPSIQQSGSPNSQRLPIQLSSPPEFQFPGTAGPPPPQQEPENGYNPFHLQENFPEPPYESEFVNDPPLDYNKESVEVSQRSAGTNDARPPPLLDFAQSTLRNLRTEELLEVVQRKKVPSECVYNTISYGPNGEDCVEARKK